MRFIIALAALLALALPASAQQQQITPTQLAHQIDDAVYGLASQVEQLQAELAKAQARIKELEGKAAPAQPPKAD